MLSTLPTYETGVDEPLHPDFMVASRFIEVAMSDCEYGCKIYADPLSRVNVLGHAKVYGCKTRKDDIVKTHRSYSMSSNYSYNVLECSE
jgi:hypothetical protein